MLSPVLCLDAAPDAAAPRLATAGGSGGLLSDASISLWRVDPRSEADDAGDSQPLDLSTRLSTKRPREHASPERAEGSSEGHVDAAPAAMADPALTCLPCGSGAGE